VLVLDTHDTTTPVLEESVVIVELSLELGAELLEVDEVFTTDVSDSDGGSCLEVDELSEVGLSADEAEGDTLLSAESGQVDDELNGVNVVGNDNKLGLVLFDEGSDVVKSELEVHGLLSLSGTTGLGLTLESQSLLDAGLGLVLGQKLEELGSLVLLKGLSELVDLRRDLQSLHQDSLLSLDADVLGPSDETSEVTLGLDVSSKTEVLGILLEERSRASSATSTSFRLNDLLSLSFLHHND